MSQLQVLRLPVPAEKADVRHSPSFAAATMISQGYRKPIDMHRWNHGGVQIWLEAKEFGPHVTWYKMVQILQGMANLGSVKDSGTR